MDGVIFGIFSISVILFISGLYHFFSIKKPGFYPPKPVLRKRATLFTLGAAICFIFGLFMAALFK